MVECIDGKFKLTFGRYDIELCNDNVFKLNSADNNFKYDFVYHDDEALEFRSSRHAIRVFEDGQFCKSAILCAVAGATTIHPQSAVVDGNDIFICCANKVFSLSLPDLTINWIKQVDMATCFGIYKADGALFTHGEMSISRLSQAGEIVWETGLRDIIINIEEDREQEEFVMHETYISLLDFSSNKYQLGFDGKFISEQLSDRQKYRDSIDKKLNQKHKNSWWNFWS